MHGIRMNSKCLGPWQFGFGVFLGLAIPPALFAQSASLSKDTLLMGVREQQSLIRTIEGTFKVSAVRIGAWSHELAEEHRPPGDIVQKEKIDFAVEGKKLRTNYAFHRDPAGEGYQYEREWAFNGEHGAWYEPRQSRAEVWHGEAPGCREHMRYQTVLLRQPATKNGLGVSDYNLGSLLQAKQARVRPNLESVEGAQCHVVDLIFDGIVAMTAWINASRGFLPVKSQFFRKGGVPYEEYQLSRIVEVGEGIWLPLKCVQKSHYPFSAEFAMTIEGADGDTPSLFVNREIPKGKFVIDFPPRTLVYDHALEVTYLAGSGMEHHDLEEYTNNLFKVSENAGYPVEPPAVDVEGALQSTPATSKAVPTALVSPGLPASEVARQHMFSLWMKGLLFVGPTFLVLAALWMRARRRQT